MKKILSLLLTTAFMLSVVACGTATPAAQQDSQNSNVLRVGMECNYAPFNWSTTQASEHTVALSQADHCDGYDVAIAKTLANKLGKTLEIKKIDWDGLIPSLNNNDIDLIIAGMTATEERLKAVNFTTPYYESQMVVLVKKGSELENIKNIQELSGKKVLGQLATIYDEIIDQIEGVIHVTPQDAYPRMVLSLQTGEVDALTAELPVAESVLKNNPDLAIVTFEEGQGFVADTSVSIALRKADTELLKNLQEALDSITEAERVAFMSAALDRQEN